MAPETQLNDDGRTIEVRLSGSICSADIIELIRKIYPTLGSKNALWDMREVDVSTFTAEERHAIAAAAKASLRRGGTPKIAYVVSAGPSFVAQCKYMNEAVAWSMPAEYAVFMDLESASAWLERRH